MALHTVDTALGAVAYEDSGGVGPTVLFVHGSPGDHQQGVLETAFLVGAGFRVVCPSRPGYSGTPLTGANRTPAAQAELHVALLDALDHDRVGVACWSGGGPSSYLLAAGHPDRVAALVGLAAVSGPYTFAGGVDERLLETKVGAKLIDLMADHAPKSLAKSTLAAEGDLSRSALHALVEHVWDDEAKRAFLLALARDVTGHHDGLDNDHAQYPDLGELPLASVTAPTLLVHGTVDTDVPPEHSERAAAAIGGAELARVEGGTHLATWTDPTSGALQARIAAFLRDGG